MHVYRVHVCVGVCSCVCKRDAGACGRKRSMPNAFPLFLDLTFDIGSLTDLQLLTTKELPSLLVQAKN